MRYLHFSCIGFFLFLALLSFSPMRNSYAQEAQSSVEELLQQERYDDAMRQCEGILASRPADVTARTCEHEAAIAQALRLRRNGKQAEALLCLERARAVLPDDPVLLTDLGIEADFLHHYNEAAEALETALTLRPADPAAQYALARTNADRQRPELAEPLFRAYLARRPDDASAHYGLGRLLQLLERTEEAAAEFNRSIELQPIQTEAYYQLGQIALDAGHDEQAQAAFERTLSRLPTHGGALTNMGILAYRRKQYATARLNLGKAVLSSPDYETAHYYLGLTLGRLGEKAASRHELAVARELILIQQGKGAPAGIDGYAP